MGITDGYIAPGTGDTCPKCNKRKSTTRWADGELALTHGWIIYICEICAVTEQLEHAKERAAKIPELEAKLKELEAQDV